MEELTRASLEALIASRLAADPGFRQQLLANPREVLTELTGMVVPEAVVINVYQESATEIHCVIPVRDSELSDEDLSLVAGGWSPIPVEYPSRNCGP